MEKFALSSQKCAPCEGGIGRLKPVEVKKLLRKLNGWKVSDGSIKKTFSFKNYYETTAFVNAAVSVAHREDHHPDITFGYKQCEVVYSTHSVKGLTVNDFTCAAKLDALLPDKGPKS